METKLECGSGYSNWGLNLPPVPDELGLNIFSYLPIPALLNAQLVCREWHRIGSDNVLWNGFYRKYFPDIFSLKSDCQYTKNDFINRAAKSDQIKNIKEGTIDPKTIYSMENSRLDNCVRYKVLEDSAAYLFVNEKDLISHLGTSKIPFNDPILGEAEWILHSKKENKLILVFNDWMKFNMQVWDLQSTSCIEFSYEGCCICPVFTPDEKSILCGIGLKVCLLNCETGECTDYYSLEVSAIAFSENKKFVVIGTYVGKVEILNYNSKDKIFEKQMTSKLGLMAISLLPYENLLVVYSEGFKRFLLLETNQGNEIKTIVEKEPLLSGACIFSADGRQAKLYGSVKDSDGKRQYKIILYDFCNNDEPLEL